MSSHNIPDWDTYFMNLLEPISSRSKDPNTKVGCVIVSKDNNIISTGYNSFPRGICDDKAERFERPEKYLWIEHGDRNAIYAAARVGTALEGSRMYLTGLPCMDCSRAIIQVGIKEVIYDADKQAKWEKTNTPYNATSYKTKQMLEEGKVALTAWWKV